MRVAVGGIAAHCAKCGGEEFEVVPGTGELLHERRYACPACQVSFQYTDLLMQIGDKAITQAKASTSKW